MFHAIYSRIFHPYVGRQHYGGEKTGHSPVETDANPQVGTMGVVCVEKTGVVHTPQRTFGFCHTLHHRAAEIAYLTDESFCFQIVSKQVAYAQRDVSLGILPLRFDSLVIQQTFHAVCDEFPMQGI